jgi:hypothetical protein
MALGNVAMGNADEAETHMKTFDKIGGDWMKSLDSLFLDTDGGKGSSQKMLADINSGRVANEAQASDPALAHANVVTRPPSMGSVAPAPAQLGHSKIEVHGVKGDPSAVGNAVAKGVADGNKRALQDAQRATTGGA